MSSWARLNEVSSPSMTANVKDHRNSSELLVEFPTWLSVQRAVF